MSSLQARASDVVLREKPVQFGTYGKNSSTYISMVSKWRHHFYGVIDHVHENACTAFPPVTFKPIREYFDGFVIRYYDISALPTEIGDTLRMEGEETEGWHQIDKKRGIIRIFYDKRVPETRQRFTVAHEWGHVFQSLDLSFKSDMESVSDPSERNRIIESVADHFAGYYLVPQNLLQRELGQFDFQTSPDEHISYLANRFNVSNEAMTHRLTARPPQ